MRKERPGNLYEPWNQDSNEEFDIREKHRGMLFITPSGSTSEERDVQRSMRSREYFNTVYSNEIKSREEEKSFGELHLCLFW